MRKARKDAQEVADDWFFENTIRLSFYHRIIPYSTHTLQSC